MTKLTFQIGDIVRSTINPGFTYTVKKVNQRTVWVEGNFGLHTDRPLYTDVNPNSLVLVARPKKEED